ncbi:MAG: hypothetical protein V7K14_19970 [Nostoc sp.]|uniref:hypothetical protein n=1 Tax=Nostoc sp. TaxID=1180 RepID=UPI002FF613B0
MLNPYASSIYDQRIIKKSQQESETRRQFLQQGEPPQRTVSPIHWLDFALNPHYKTVPFSARRCANGVAQGIASDFRLV